MVISTILEKFTIMSCSSSNDFVYLYTFLNSCTVFPLDFIAVLICYIDAFESNRQYPTLSLRNSKNERSIVSNSLYWLLKWTYFLLCRAVASRLIISIWKCYLFQIWWCFYGKFLFTIKLHPVRKNTKISSDRRVIVFILLRNRSTPF